MCAARSKPAARDIKGDSTALRVHEITVGRARDIMDSWAEKYPVTLSPQERKLARLQAARSAPMARKFSAKSLLESPDKKSGVPMATPADAIVGAFRAGLTNNGDLHVPETPTADVGSISDLVCSGDRGTADGDGVGAVSDAHPARSMPPVADASALPIVDSAVFQRSVNDHISRQKQAFESRLAGVPGRKPSTQSLPVVAHQPPAAGSTSTPAHPTPVRQSSSASTLKQQASVRIDASVSRSSVIERECHGHTMSVQVP